MAYFINEEDGALHLYDDKNNNVPVKAIAITDQQFQDILDHKYGISAFKISAGSLVSDADAIAALDKEVFVNAISSKVQATLDEAAQQAGYDSIHTAVTYADEPASSLFQAEGQSFRSWRSQCWEYCYGLLDQHNKGLIPTPTIDEVIAGLPARVLP